MPAADPAGVVSLSKAWYNLMVRIGVYGPGNVQAAARQLDRIDRITGINTRRKAQ